MKTFIEISRILEEATKLRAELDAGAHDVLTPGARVTAILGGTTAKPVRPTARDAVTVLASAELEARRRGRTCEQGQLDAAAVVLVSELLNIPIGTLAVLAARMS